MSSPDVHSRAIVGAGAAIALAVLLAVLAVFLLLGHWKLPASADRARLSFAPVLGAPALESAPQVDQARYRAEKQQLLDSSAWVDRSRGVVRIPIATAMDILADRAAATASRGPNR